MTKCKGAIDFSDVCSHRDQSQLSAPLPPQTSNCPGSWRLNPLTSLRVGSQSTPNCGRSPVRLPVFRRWAPFQNKSLDILQVLRAFLARTSARAPQLTLRASARDGASHLLYLGRRLAPRSSFQVGFQDLSGREVYGCGLFMVGVHLAPQSHSPSTDLPAPISHKQRTALIGWQQQKLSDMMPTPWFQRPRSFQNKSSR